MTIPSINGRPLLGRRAPVSSLARAPGRPVAEDTGRHFFNLPDVPRRGITLRDEIDELDELLAAQARRLRHQAVVDRIWLAGAAVFAVGILAAAWLT